MARKDVLDLDDFRADEIDQVMVTAESMREVLSRPIRRVPPVSYTI
jgi:aspartate carbamoyltransferase catalytic subunit